MKPTSTEHISSKFSPQNSLASQTFLLAYAKNHNVVSFEIISLKLTVAARQLKAQPNDLFYLSAYTIPITQGLLNHNESDDLLRLGIYERKRADLIDGGFSFILSFGIDGALRPLGEEKKSGFTSEIILFVRRVQSAIYDQSQYIPEP